MDINIIHIPDTPGCYIFWDNGGDCLYVGKSKNVKSRVRSYFNKGNPPKTQKLVRLINRVEYRPAADELEALYLEHGLIKTYRPPFNSQMKRDYSPYFICIEWGQTTPGLYISHNPTPEATPYGGFFSDYDARDALAILNRAWGIPTCEQKYFDSARDAHRSCLNSHIGKCLGPCIAGNAAYNEHLKFVAAFMQGKNKDALQDIELEMSQAAMDFDYEKAAGLRDLVHELKHLQKRFAYQVSFKDRRVWVFIKGHHEDRFRFLYYKNGDLRYMESFGNNKEPSQTEKKKKIIHAMSNNKNTAINLPESAKIYTTVATKEIRAIKYYVDVTNTPSTSLAKKLDKALTHFIQQH
ncbi:MAG: GIY-YIG nuclease family protein [Defluviitaleaceae bacterium]|nr:GIY-YIG nuclease family protein [Defluviitaleaceae bacterium]